MNIVNKLISISGSCGYWLMYIVGSFTLLSAALYFQFIREELPCLMCIQVRLLISLLIIVSIVGLVFFSKKAVGVMTHLASVLVFAGLTERSYQLLGTERGFVFGDCGFSLGLPTWFAIEDWLPWLFRVETSCGYTPEVIFGITMAEALMVLSTVFLVFSLSVFVAYLTQLKSTE